MLFWSGSWQSSLCQFTICHLSSDAVLQSGHKAVLAVLGSTAVGIPVMFSAIVPIVALIALFAGSCVGFCGAVTRLQFKTSCGSYSCSRCRGVPEVLVPTSINSGEIPLDVASHPSKQHYCFLSILCCCVGLRLKYIGSGFEGVGADEVCLTAPFFF